MQSIADVRGAAATALSKARSRPAHQLQAGPSQHEKPLPWDSRTKVSSTSNLSRGAAASRHLPGRPAPARRGKREQAGSEGPSEAAQDSAPSGRRKADGITEAAGAVEPFSAIENALQHRDRILAINGHVASSRKHRSDKCTERKDNAPTQLEQGHHQDQNEEEHTPVWLLKSNVGCYFVIGFVRCIAPVWLQQNQPGDDSHTQQLFEHVQEWCMLQGATDLGEISAMGSQDRQRRLVLLARARRRGAVARQQAVQHVQHQRALRECRTAAAICIQVLCCSLHAWP